jgi:hypothetical protein
MPEWQIELVGDARDIGLLESFLTDSPYQITTWKKRKFLTIPGVSLEADSESVHAASTKLLDVINGAMKLYYRRFGGVSFVHVFKFNDDGKRVGFGYLTVPDSNYTLYAFNPKDKTIIEWVEMGLDDEEIERALYLYGSLELNWKNLYMVLEIIEDSFGGETPLLKANPVSENDIKLFKRTANSYKAIGREARHGKINFESPPVPMTLAKAQDVMSKLLKGWIKFKN